ncbi:MAG: hypothetical protein IJJ23_00865 [Clostridia bacterium]|nr:hypothetical protein [Clostridia bacterium]
MPVAALLRDESFGGFELETSQNDVAGRQLELYGRHVTQHIRQCPAIGGDALPVGHKEIVGLQKKRFDRFLVQGDFVSKAEKPKEKRHRQHAVCYTIKQYYRIEKTFGSITGNEAGKNESGSIRREHMAVSG